jgi:hypothetical protein
MSNKFNYDNCAIIIARFKEETEWVNKISKFNKVHIYEKEKPDHPYNVPKNRGNEASAYLKYIIDNYNNLPSYLVLIHCHESSWHHTDSIVDIINSYIGKEIKFENINDPKKCNDMGNYQDWVNGDVGNFYQKLIKPAVGAHTIHENWTDKQPGCAQFIIHKDRILDHSLDFYKDIFDWIMNVDVSFKNHGFYLEWTWELFWNRWLKNSPIKIYEKEDLLFAFQLDKNNNFIEDITYKVKEELKNNDCYKVDDKVKIVIIKNNVISKELVAKNYIFNKYK